MMEISIVVPTYNRANFLRKNLRFLIRQNFAKIKYEILVCDDGSNDNTERVVSSFVKKYHSPKIKWLYQKNQGPAAARNLGINKAEGRIIAFTDDDCQPDCNWLSEIERAFQENPKIIGIGGVTYTNKHLVTPLTCQIENIQEDCFPTCNVAYKKSALQKIGGFDEKFPPTNEDADLSWRIEKIGKILHNPKMRVLHPPREATFAKEIKGVSYLGSEFRLFEKMPALYRQKRGNPYRQLLYWYGLRFGAKRLIQAASWIFKNPLIYGQLFALIVCQRVYLIILMPGFIVRHRKRINQKSNLKYQNVDQK